MSQLPSSSSQQSKTRTRLFFLLALIVVLVGWFAWQGRQQTDNKAALANKKKDMPVPVQVASVTAQTMPVEIRTIGNVEPISTVTLKPQIEGKVTGIYFREGTLVSQGQLLFTIDTQPIEASLAQAQAIVSKDRAMVAQARATLAKDQTAVEQAQATLDKDLAQLVYNETQERRFATLLKQEFASQDQYDQAVTARKASEATVASDRSAIANAKAVLVADQASIRSAQDNVEADQAIVESYRIKLAYGRVTAPFSGRTGSLKIHVGDTVKVGDTELVRLDKLNPIFVGFSVPEQSLKSVKVQANTRNFPVVAVTREDPPSKLHGTVNFLDNTVDTTTGTIRMKALFQNHNQLWPGQFVDVVLNLAQQANAIVIPLNALQTGQNGDYVFRVQNRHAYMRAIVVDRIVGQEVVVRSGLTPGETVVTDGQFQLSDGSLIHNKNQSPPSK